MWKVILFLLDLCFCFIEGYTQSLPEESRGFDLKMSYDNSEIFVGEKGTVLLNITLPNTTLQNLSVVLERNISNIDFGISHVTGGQREEYFTTPDFKVAFWRSTNLTIKFTDINSTSLRCDVGIYLHNGKGLNDKEIFSISAFLLLNEQLMFNDTVLIEARTSMKKEMFKISRAEVSKPRKVASLTETALAISFKAWIPIYNPVITVNVTKKINGVSENKFSSIDNLFKIIYVKVTRVGENFKPEAKVNLLSSLNCSGMDTIKLKFPTDWVNRGYYQSEYTTDDDVIEFETLLSFTNFSEVASTSLVNIDIWLNGSSIWKRFDLNLTDFMKSEDISNSSLQGDSDSATHSAKLSIKSAEDLSDEIQDSPFNTKRLLLYLDVQNQESFEEETTLLVDVAFTNVLKHQKPSVSLRSINISFMEATDNIHCIDVNISYSKTDYFLSENDAEIKINYLKNVLENSKPAWMSFEIIVEFICKNRCIGISEYRILASISKQNSTIMYTKTIQQPEIFHDVNNTLLSQLYSILDNDSTTCVSLPRNGHMPPVFWIRIQNYWLDIFPKRFILTLFGENLSCSGYNERSIQVSYPTSSSKGRFHGELRHCQLTGTQIMHNPGSQCTFLCPCTNPVECSEVFVFLAAEKQIKWKLCEISAISL